MSDIVVRLKRQIAPIVFGKSETVHGVIVDAIVEIERLRAENATLRERVKLWESLADPNAIGSGRVHREEDR